MNATTTTTLGTAALAGLRTAHPGADRPGQVEMVARVVAAIEAGDGQTVVEAPTGVGKSSGYLVPAILSRRRTVVVTATKALQDQLAEHDLPTLAATLRPFTWEVLKGRSNYVCAAALADAVGDGQFDVIAAQKLADDPELAAVARWAATTRTGDMNDINPSPKVREMVTVTADECPGAKKCDKGREGLCFAEQAKGRARTAEVVVVNMALYAADVASGGRMLGPHDIVAVDECQRFEDVMASGLGVELGARQLAKAAVAADRVLPPGDDRVALFSTATTAFAAAMKLAGDELLTEIPAGLAEALTSLREGVDGVMNRIAGVVVPEGEPEPDPDYDLEFDDRKTQRAYTLLGSISERLSGIRPDSDAAVFVENETLRVVPLDISALLRQRVWRDRSVVLASATVPRNITAKLGLETDVVHVPSPFDLKTNARLYVNKNLPDPTREREAWKVAAWDEMEALISAAGGRTLALFSSRVAMREAADELRRRVPYRIITPDDMPKNAAVREFAADETSCLFGTQGFYEGVNVPGRACTLVIIDRVPFPRPDDPLCQARQNRHGGGFAAFLAVAVNHAAVLLTQAGGRLVRSATDRGVVAVLDPRIAGKWPTYGRTLVAGLADMKMTGDRDEVARFLAECAAPAPQPALATAVASTSSRKIGDVF